MYIFMYVWVCIYDIEMYMCSYVYRQTCMSMCMHISGFLPICMHVGRHVSVCTYKHILHVCMYAYGCLYVYMYIGRDA